MSTFTSRVYLLRHGELELKDVLAGHTDLLLSSFGWAQLEKACDHLPVLDCIHSSSLRRCAEYAKQISKRNNKSPLLTDEIKEFNFGDWDGQLYSSLWCESASPSIGDFWQDPWRVSVPNGEAMPVFYQRVFNWWQGLLQSIIDNQTKTHLVITHGGVIKQLLAIICQMPKETNIHNNVFSIPYAGKVCIDIFIDENAQTWPKIVF